VTDSTPVNFRTRTGQVRRARTRAKILSAAFTLLDRAAVSQLTVEHVRETAGLARGSFYNYFPTYEDMLKDLAAQISRQINLEQSARFDGVENLEERLWCNAQYFILRAASDRACSEILIRIAPLVGALNENMREHAEQDIRLAIRRKSIRVPSATLALDLGYGVATVMIRRALTSAINPKEIEAAGLMLLRAYGVEYPDSRCQRYPRCPCALPSSAILKRVRARRVTPKGTQPRPPPRSAGRG
jgi:AcrR family transcriptional regulator